MRLKLMNWGRPTPPPPPARTDIVRFFYRFSYMMASLRARPATLKPLFQHLLCRRLLRQLQAPFGELFIQRAQLQYQNGFVIQNFTFQTIFKAKAFQLQLLSMSLSFRYAFDKQYNIYDHGRVLCTAFRHACLSQICKTQPKLLQILRRQCCLFCFTPLLLFIKRFN